MRIFTAGIPCVYCFEKSNLKDENYAKKTFLKENVE